MSRDEQVHVEVEAADPFGEQPRVVASGADGVAEGREQVDERLDFSPGSATSTTAGG